MFKLSEVATELFFLYLLIMVVVTPDNPKLDITKVCKYCKGQYVAPSKTALRKHVQRTHKEAHVKYTKSYPTTLEYYSYECPDCIYSGPSFETTQI